MANKPLRDPHTRSNFRIAAVEEDSPAAVIFNYEFFGQLPSVPTETGLIGVWTGAAWAKKPAKVFQGGSWTQKPVKRWNGSGWV